MKARRTNRIAGIVGLLVALVLAISGCGVVNSVLGKGDSGDAFSAPVTKPMLASDWVDDYGKDPALPKQISDAGVKIMAVMFDAFPQYTVAGFTPSEQNWTESSEKIKPLVSAQSFQTLQSYWDKNKTLPAMTSYHEDQNVAGKYTNDFQTSDGQTCGATDKPYSLQMVTVILNSQSKVPLFNGVVGVTAQCKDGSTLKGKMRMSFQMEKNDAGDWVMKDSYKLNNAEAFTVTK